MATTYTWKVTTLKHDRALEAYLNKAKHGGGVGGRFHSPRRAPGARHGRGEEGGRSLEGLLRKRVGCGLGPAGARCCHCFSGAGAFSGQAGGEEATIRENGIETHLLNATGEDVHALNAHCRWMGSMTRRELLEAIVGWSPVIAYLLVALVIFFLLTL
jgi:hypothetical protein